MSSTANYASIPKTGSASVTTGDTSLTAPALANTGQVVTARSNGARIDRLLNVAGGTSVASMLRIWAVEGFPGKGIQGITFVGTTATVTTIDPHGLASGDLYNSQGAEPRQYNVKSAAVTVLTPTTFTFVMGGTPTTNATVVGQYSTTPAAPTFSLLKEIPIQGAIVPSATVQAWNRSLCEATDPDIFPIVLPAGYQLRTSVRDTQTSSSIISNAFGGDL